MADSSSWKAVDLRGLLFGVVGGILIIVILGLALLAWGSARRVVEPALDRQLRERVASTVALVESSMNAAVTQLEIAALSHALPAALGATAPRSGPPASDPDVLQADGRRSATRYLESVVEESDFSSLALADLEARVAAASEAADSVLFGDEEWARRTAGSGSGLAVPEPDRARNRISLRLGVPVRSETGAVIGVLGGRLELEPLRSRLEGLAEGWGFAQIVDHRGRLVIDSQAERPLGEHPDPAALVAGRRTETDGSGGERLVGWVAPALDGRWTVAYWVPEDQAFGLVRAARRAVAVLVLIAFVTAAVGIAIAGAWVAREIGRPVQMVADAADRVRAGDLRIRLGRVGTGEVARLCGAVQSMIDRLNDLVGSIHEASLETQAGSQEIASAVAQLSAGAQEMNATLARLTEDAARQSDTVQRINAEMETLGAGARELSGGADTASQRSRQLRAQAEQSRELLRHGKEQVERMAERSDLATSRLLEFLDASRQFAEFVDLIKQFARRTNLLALNAAIEAARAGGEARGFAVLAAEIRKLSNQAGEAAERVETTSDAVLGQIESVSRAVDETRQATRTIGGVVDRIDESLGKVTTAMEEADLWAARVAQVGSRVDASLERMAERLSQVAIGLGDFAAAMEGLAAGMAEQNASTEEIAAAVTNLSSSAWQLAGRAEVFAVEREDRADERQRLSERLGTREEATLVDAVAD